MKYTPNRADLHRLQAELSAAHSRIAALEDQLRQDAVRRERDYRAIMDDQTDLICRYTPEFVITFANRAHAAQHGKQPEEMIGLNVLDLVDPADREAARQHVLSLTPARPVSNSDHRSVTADGGIHWVQWTDRAFFDESGRVVEYQGVGRDVTERRLLVEALRGSEERYRSLLESSDAAITMFDGSGTLLYINQNAADALGLAPQAAVGQTQQQLFPPAVADYQLNAIRQVISSGIGVVQEAPSSVQGQQRWYRTSIQPVRDATGQVFAALVNALDITRLKQTELALRHTEQRFQQFMAHLPGTVFMFEADETLVYCNDQYAQSLAFASAQELIGKQFAAYLPAETVELARRENAQVLAENRSIEINYTIASPNGSRDWLMIKFPIPREDTAPLICAICLDVTREKRAERAMRASETRYRTLIETIDGIVTLTDASGQILFMNEHGMRLFNLPPEQRAGKMIAELFSADAAAAYLRGVQDVLRSGKGSSVELHLELADESHWFEANMQPLFDAQGELTGVLTNSINITRRKEAQLAAQRSMARLAGLHALDKAILAAQTPQQIAQITLQHLIKLLPCQRAAISQVDPQTNIAVSLAVYAETATTLHAGSSYTLLPAELDALTTRRYLLIESLAQHPGAGAALLTDAGLRTALIIGLKVERQLIGTLLLYARQADFFTDEYIDIALEVADQLTLGLHTTALTAALRAHAADLETRVAERTAQLAAAKARAEAIFESSSDGIVLTSPTGIIQQSNGAYRALFGCQGDGCVGKAMIGRLATEHRERLTSAYAAVRTQGTVQRLTARALRHDGSPFDVELGLAPVRQTNGDQDGIVCVLRDITERKQQERQQRYYASLQQNVSDAVIATDLDFNIQSWNPAAERTYGWFASEVLGKHSGAVLRTQYPEGQTRETVMQTFWQTGWWSGEVIQSRKDGSLIHIHASINLFKDAQGTPIGIVGINVDITRLKQAEQKLRESETHYRLLAENITDLVVQLNPEGKYVYVSPSSASMVGWSPDDLLDQPVTALIHPDDLPTLESLYLYLVEQKKSLPVFFYRIRHRDGHYVWLETKTHPLYADDGTLLGLVASSRDITARRQAEEKLRRYTTEVHDLYNNAPTGYHSVDADGVFVRINDTELRMLGYTREEVIGKLRFSDLLTPESLRAFQQHFPVFKQRGYVQDLEFDLLRKDGTVLPVLISATAITDEQGNYLHSRSTVVDITERKAAEIALRESEARYRTVIMTMSEGVVLQGQDGIIQACNAAAERILGLTAEQMMGRTSVDPRWQAIQPDGSPFPGETHPAMVTLRTGEPQANIVMGVHKPEDTLTWISINASPVPNPEGGKPLAVVATFKDISDQIFYQESLERALQQERDLNALKSRFVSTASHEFRTPLATILALVETLSAYRHKLTDEQVSARLEKIKGQIGYLNTIMEDILQLSRIQAQRVSFSPVSTDVDALCRSVIDDFREHNSPQRPLFYRAAAGLPQVYVDHKLTRQIISNLVSNALKYSPEDKAVHVTLDAAEDCLVLRVQDEGIGIPEDDLKHLFEPFHRAANVGAIAGTGLGLVITRESVELHGGSITVASTVNAGTTFTVRLPITLSIPPEGVADNDDNSAD